MMLLLPALFVLVFARSKTAVQMQSRLISCSTARALYLLSDLREPTGFKLAKPPAALRRQTRASKKRKKPQNEIL
jgi:hypothetical protein